MVIILGMLLNQLAPVMIPLIADAIKQGRDPYKIDWVDVAKHYGRSTEELEAEVDAQKERG